MSVVGLIQSVVRDRDLTGATTRGYPVNRNFYDVLARSDLFHFILLSHTDGKNSFPDCNFTRFCL